MSGFVQKYTIDQHSTSILDVGSMNCHPNRGAGSTYKELFDSAEYTGLDLDAGPNVDIVASVPYVWPIADCSFDVVISGQCLEHVEAPWFWIKEVARVCQSPGLVIVIAPWRWAEHKRPVDCWRILPDGMKFLLEYAGLEVVEYGKSNKDCYGVAKKP